VRETGMVPYEYLLSESQERMLFVAHKGREQELIDIFHRWGLQAVVAGTVIEESIVRILFQGKIAAEIPATALADNTPIYHRELLPEPPEYVQKAWEWSPESLPVCTTEGIEISGNFQTWNDILLTLLDTPSIASKRWVYRQYDHQVQNNTVLFPGGADAAVVRVRPLEGEVNPAFLNKGVAATVDCNSRYVYLNPYEGAKAVVAEAARNLSCVGAEPIAVTDNLNFGSPEKPVGYWQLAESCRGIAEACKEFNTPVTGGNVSLYNETLDSEGNPQSIYPTPVIGMVGIISDLTKICGQGWQSEGDFIYLLGRIPIESKVENSKSKIVLGASEYLAAIHGIVAGKPPEVDYDLERLVQAACREGISRGWVRSAHDCAEGGLAVALAEACISGKLGAEVNLGVSTEKIQRWDSLLFGEGGARILVSVVQDYAEIWESYLYEALGSDWQKIGRVGNANHNLRILTSDKGKHTLTSDKGKHTGLPLLLIDVSIAVAGDRYSHAIERRLAV